VRSGKIFQSLTSYVTLAYVSSADVIFSKKQYLSARGFRAAVVIGGRLGWLQYRVCRAIGEESNHFGIICIPTTTFTQERDLTVYSFASRTKPSSVSGLYLTLPDPTFSSFNAGMNSHPT
jgi:hypothetical protein